jgi:hypothetical protein
VIGFYHAACVLTAATRSVLRHACS